MEAKPADDLLGRNALCTLVVPLMPNYLQRKMDTLQSEIVACTQCSRLRDHCTRIATAKRKSYQDWEYWGKPVPSFGKVDARVLIVGLAPGAHGANRTGRMFTGDRSGEFLYRALHATGFATQPTSISIDDGLELIDCFITAPVHCAPPDNKPTTGEFARCSPFLERELALLKHLKVVVTLGGLAHRAYLKLQKNRGNVKSLSQYPFAHGAMHEFPARLPSVVCCYHPSQQNTQTGRLTHDMLAEVFTNVRRLAARGAPQ